MRNYLKLFLIVVLGSCHLIGHPARNSMQSTGNNHSNEDIRLNINSSVVTNNIQINQTNSEPQGTGISDFNFDLSQLLNLNLNTPEFQQIKYLLELLSFYSENQKVIDQLKRDNQESGEQKQKILKEDVENLLRTVEILRRNQRFLQDKVNLLESSTVMNSSSSVISNSPSHPLSRFSRDMDYSSWGTSNSLNSSNSSHSNQREQTNHQGTPSSRSNNKSTTPKREIKIPVLNYRKKPTKPPMSRNSFRNKTQTTLPITTPSNTNHITVSAPNNNIQTSTPTFQVFNNPIKHVSPPQVPQVRNEDRKGMSTQQRLSPHVYRPTFNPRVNNSLSNLQNNKPPVLSIRNKPPRVTQVNQRKFPNPKTEKIRNNNAWNKSNKITTKPAIPSLSKIYSSQLMESKVLPLRRSKQKLKNKSRIKNPSIKPNFVSNTEKPKKKQRKRKRKASKNKQQKERLRLEKLEKERKEKEKERLKQKRLEKQRKEKERKKFLEKQKKNKLRNKKNQRRKKESQKVSKRVTWKESIKVDYHLRNKVLNASIKTMKRQTFKNKKKAFEKIKLSKSLDHALENFFGEIENGIVGQRVNTDQFKAHFIVLLDEVLGFTNIVQGGAFIYRIYLGLANSQDSGPLLQLFFNALQASYWGETECWELLNNRDLRRMCFGDVKHCYYVAYYLAQYQDIYQVNDLGEALSRMKGILINFIRTNKLGRDAAGCFYVYIDNLLYNNRMDGLSEVMQALNKAENSSGWAAHFRRILLQMFPKAFPKSFLKIKNKEIAFYLMKKGQLRIEVIASYYHIFGQGVKDGCLENLYLLVAKQLNSMLGNKTLSAFRGMQKEEFIVQFCLILDLLWEHKLINQTKAKQIMGSLVMKTKDAELISLFNKVCSYSSKNGGLNKNTNTKEKEEKQQEVLNRSSYEDNREMFLKIAKTFFLSQLRSNLLKSLAQDLSLRACFAFQEIRTEEIDPSSHVEDINSMLKQILVYIDGS